MQTSTYKQAKQRGNVTTTQRKQEKQQERKTERQERRYAATLQHEQQCTAKGKRTKKQIHKHTN